MKNSGRLVTLVLSGMTLLIGMNPVFGEPLKTRNVFLTMTD